MLFGITIGDYLNFVDCGRHIETQTVDRERLSLRTGVGESLVMCWRHFVTRKKWPGRQESSGQARTFGLMFTRIRGRARYGCEAL